MDKGVIVSVSCGDQEGSRAYRGTGLRFWRKGEERRGLIERSLSEGIKTAY